MGFVYANPNPVQNVVGDCVIRGICILTDSDWETTYTGVAIEGMLKYDMPSSNAVWTSYLKRLGYVRRAIPNTCPDCYTVKDFCRDFYDGRYLLGTGSHVVCVINGDYYDTWDSGDEVPVYYWQKGVK